ncbi:hypothetical protein WS68_07055 [Burkholderia sp. TSV86]|nr:hypothetical protein WS68_07055 [Burkholderia sp. TSV86]
MRDANQRDSGRRVNPSRRNRARPFMQDRIDAWRRRLLRPPNMVKHCENNAQQGLQTFCYI